MKKIVVFLLLSILFSVVMAGTQEKRVYQTTKIGSEKLVIDGKIDDEAWNIV
ncbi:MAG: hypothetical protein H8E57_08375, partial [Candidatus Cloacimonetes bacterium]|nr:hypothetical protein [Candidatus Cloacimonadota bacterium]